jgi:hypothetical protein
MDDPNSAYGSADLCEGAVVDDDAPNEAATDDGTMSGMGTSATTGSAWGSLFDGGWLGAAVAIAVLPIVWVVRKLRMHATGPAD